MIKKCDFKNPTADYFYALAPYSKYKVKYPEGDTLKNEYNAELGDHDYISLISREKYTAGVEIYARFRFEGLGAPCLAFTDDVEESEDFPVYGKHFEVCIYKDGVNVWRVVPYPPRVERPIKPTKLYFENWTVSSEDVECTVKFGKRSITVSVEGHEFTVENEEFPDSFRLGFTACEGLCEFKIFEVRCSE